MWDGDKGRSQQGGERKPAIQGTKRPVITDAIVLAKGLSEHEVLELFTELQALQTPKLEEEEEGSFGLFDEEQDRVYLPYGLGQGQHAWDRSQVKPMEEDSRAGGDHKDMAKTSRGREGDQATFSRCLGTGRLRLTSARLFTLLGP